METDITLIAMSVIILGLLIDSIISHRTIKKLREQNGKAE